MIDLRIRIKNPFHNEVKSPWKSIYQWEKLITTNKFLEIGFFKYAYSLFEFNLNTDVRGTDHAGPDFSLSVLGYEFRIAMRDKRHWNYENNSWETV